MTKIRRYMSSDLDRCRSLWAEMNQHHREIYEDPSIGGENPGMAFDGHLSKVGPERVWVAESGEEVVGFVSLIHEGEEAEIEPMVVSREHRGRGIGRQLLARAVNEARSLGVVCLCVKPTARNQAAVAFFHCAGFRTLGHVQQFMWLGETFPGQWKKGPELFGKPFDC